MQNVLPPERLRHLLLDNAQGFDLAEAVLLLSQKDYPALDIPYYLRRLDALAAHARAHLPASAGELERVAVLNRILFDEEGFRGNAEDYYDPRNSYLNEVLDRKCGIPISLSILYLAVGQRLGLSLEGVSFPGHFLVKLATGSSMVVLDPFVRGQVVSEVELRLLLQTVQVGDLPLATADLLASASKIDILVRVLRNLRGIYWHQQDLDHALYVVNCILALVPDNAESLRDRGRIYERLECFRAALEDFSRYLELEPGAADHRDVRARLPVLLQAAARLN